MYVKYHNNLWLSQCFRKVYHNCIAPLLIKPWITKFLTTFSDWLPELSILIPLLWFCTLLYYCLFSFISKYFASHLLIYVNWCLILQSIPLKPVTVYTVHYFAFCVNAWDNMDGWKEHIDSFSALLPLASNMKKLFLFWLHNV